MVCSRSFNLSAPLARLGMPPVACGATPAGSIGSHHERRFDAHGRSSHHRYLRENPTAADTVEGVHIVWVGHDLAHPSLDITQAALELLFDEGLVAMRAHRQPPAMARCAHGRRLIVLFASSRILCRPSVALLSSRFVTALSRPVPPASNPLSNSTKVSTSPWPQSRDRTVTSCCLLLG